ncbi:MAG: hypothetical protein ABIR16_05215, partial [Dokdonella sp.]
GSYAFSVPGEDGVSYRDSMLENLTINRQRHWLPSQISGVRIHRTGPGELQMRFIIDHAEVVKELAIIREFEKPRYADWYHLQHDPVRTSDVTKLGDAAHAKRVQTLGPTTEIIRDLHADADVVCRNGWLELPRNDLTGPIRLTRGEDGSILGESREINTYSVSVWCGDGCKEIGIPTGIHTGTLRWPRDDSQQPWRADAPGAYAIERPIDEIEAEAAASLAAQQHADSVHYRPVDDIRTRIQSLAPTGTMLSLVEVHDGKVWLSYRAPENDAETLLRRIADAGGSSTTSGPQEVRRIVTSSRMDERDIEFVLTESPLVLRDSDSSPSRGEIPTTIGHNNTSTDTAPSHAASTPISSLAVDEAGSRADSRSSSGPVTAQIASPVAPATQSTAGYADADEIRRRVSALFPSGCDIKNIDYANENVILSGHADAHRCVSEGLRASDLAGGRAELIQITGQESSGYDFSISLSPSKLTRR